MRYRFSIPIIIFVGVAAFSPRASALSLNTETYIGKEVVHHELKGQSTVFDVSDGNLVAWTLTTGEKESTRIVHEWYSMIG